MALTVDTVKSGIDDFLDAIQAAAEQQIEGEDIPLIGSVATMAGDAMFSALKARIHDAIDDAASVDEVAAILDALDEINATVVNGELHLGFVAGGKTDLLTPDAFNLGAQVGGVGFNLDGSFSASLNTAMNVNVVIDDAGVRVVDSGDAELRVWVDGNLSLNEAGGSLGFLDIKASDKDPNAPEVHVEASIDLPSFDIVNLADALDDIDAGFEATAGLDLDIDVVGSKFVPSMSMNLVLGLGIDQDLNVAPPEIKFNDISIDVASMFGIFAESLQQFSDILDIEPLGTFFDLTTGPVPLIDDLAHQFDMVGFFDKIPGLIPDQVVSLLDLAVLKDELQGAPANKFYDMLGLLALAKQIGGSIGPDGLINLGDLDFSGANGDATALLQKFAPALGIDPMAELDRIIEEVPAFGQIKEQIEGAFSSGTGFEIPMLDDPTLIVKFLFNSLFPGEDVDIVRFDIPDLDFKAKADVFFSILGPLGLTLKGEVNGHMDFTVGYDTAGLRAIMGGADADSLFDGFYFSTKENDDPLNPDTNPTGWDAVGHLDGRIGAGAAFRGFIVDASITGGIGFGSAERAINAWFNLDPNGDGKLRFDDLAGCFIDANGAVVADVLVEIEVGFDPFSYTDKFPLISTVIADFDLVECLTTISSPPGQGLATYEPDGFEPHDLVLNTGDRATQRVFEGGGTTSVGADVNENLEIRFARDATGGPTQGQTEYTPPDPNALDVTGFGVTQRYGVDAGDAIPDDDQKIFAIKGNLGGGNDSVVMEREIAIAAIISGGAGEDLIVTGAGNDSLEGGEDDDFLVGNAGDDTLIGGNGNDQLEGGAGADVLDGQAGRDKVSYYDAATEAVKVVVSDDGQHLVGTAGDAVGDTFSSIEYFVGTKYDDTLTTAPEASDQPSATLEGREGDDLLLGSDTKRDFLVGGAGADTMRGGALEDGTSYLASFGGVNIDLHNHIYSGGDAEGDELDSIEDVQGSGFNDFIVGDTGTNVIDGYIGDDTITGFLGADTVRGGHGDDLVYAYADGDLLDGGGYIDYAGNDTLSYELANAPAGVTVNLYTGDGGGNDTIAGGQIIVTEPLTDTEVVVNRLGNSTFENLVGSSGSDILTGDLRNNSIFGGLGDDTIDGEGGNDWLIGGAGADHFKGGAGEDWVDYRTAATGVVVALEGIGGGATLSDSTGDTFDQAFDTRVENIRGSDYTDFLLGDTRDNVIDPGLSESGSGDSVHDQVIGNGGTDTLFLDYSRGTAGKGISGGFDSGSSIAGTLYREANNSTAHIDGVDFTGIDRVHVIGSAQNDTIYGGQHADGDIITGGDGDDSIVSGRGADVVLGEYGNDSVTFGSMANRSLTTADPGLDGSSWFYIDGGAGIDKLSASFMSATQNLVFLAPRGGIESTQHNLVLANGATIDNFEVLEDINTGSGDDTIIQDGRVDNDFFTGDGNDLIYAGYGRDDINAGFEIAGLGFFNQTNEYGGNAEILDAAAFFGDVGDTLILDYSQLEAGLYVQGDSDLAHTPYTIDQVQHTTGDADDEEHVIWNLHVNVTGYRSYNADGSLGPDDVISIYHDRLTVFGSDGGDTLGGTFVTFDSARGASVRGDDMLHGRGGDDALFGETGDDTLWGDDGDDFLVGSVKQEPDGEDVSYDSVEIDHLWGGAGNDTFGIGEWDANFYLDPTAKTNNHFAVIEDFVKGEDTVQLTGPVSNYNTIVSGSDIWIRANVNNDLVAVVRGGHGFNLAQDAISAPTIPIIILPLAAQSVEPLVLDEPQTMSLLSDEPVSTLATSGDFTVEALNDPDELLQHFGSGGKFSNESLEIEGDSRAVGWFEGDPFGLGSGIVLSTGRVEDLVGPNEEGGSINAQEEVQLTFHKLGILNNNTIYVADLTGIGIDVNSITLKDSFNGGGGDGEVSGFDLNAIALSHTLLPAQEDMDDLNLPSVLSKLNVFDFTPAGTFLTPGSQRTNPEPDGRETKPDLYGAQNGYVNNGWATLGTFDGPFSTSKHVISIGEGGSIGFDLTQTLSTDAPLYLYVAEGDASTDEELTGIITASSQHVKPKADMSTDLGDTGAAGDTTTVTYHFTPGAGDELVQFQVVLFSEELPEFAGELDMDIFKFTLNGIEIGKLSDGAATTMDNLMVATYAPHHQDLILNAPGTGPAADVTRADAYTTVLTFTGRANAGVDNVLRFEVSDKGDAYLDSGVLIRTLALTGAPIPGAITVSGTGDPVEDGTNAVITVTRPADAELDSTVTVHLTPSGNIGLGESGGGGAGVDVVFGPGESGSKDVIVRAIGNDGPSEPGYVDASVTSDDPDFTNPTVPRIGFDIVDTYEVPENSLDVFDLEVPGAPDGADLTWSIAGGADAAKFEIDSSTGELSFVSAPDFEAPTDVGADNDYGVVVTAKNAAGAVVDTQKINARVTDAGETSVLKVEFVSANAGYENTLGWYDSRTGVGGILFASVDSHGRCHFRAGDTVSLEVASSAVPFISFFLIPDGGGLRANSNDELTGGIKVIQLADGSWAVATLDKHGNVETDRHGRPNLLDGAGANALFSDTSKNAGNVDYASSKVGRNQTADTLAGDTADGPTGLMAWEDIAATRRHGTYGTPGDADYDDAVFSVTEYKGITLTGTNDAERLDGGIASDFLFGKDGNDTLNGGDGGDLLDGGKGADRMNGGRDDDFYVVDDAGDLVIEDRHGGDDTVRSSISYTLTAYAERLVLIGEEAIDGTGNDLDNVITGNEAANVLDGKSGDDHLIGLGGDDTYIVDSDCDVVVERADGGTDTVRSSVSYALGDNVENLVLTGTWSISGTGNDLANQLTGNSGANRLDGGGGADRMEGNGGNDTYVVDDAGDDVVEAGGGGTDTVQSSISYVLGADVENLVLVGNADIDGTGNAGANTLVGNRDDNILDGGGGADDMRGGDGDDTYIVDSSGDDVAESRNDGNDTVRSSVSFSLGSNIENLVLTGMSAINGTGNSDDNLLIGNDAANVLRAGSGSDIIIGGAGADRLYGGDDRSRDTFVFQAIGDSGTTSSAWDLVYDFDRNIDKLDLSAIDAGGDAGDQAFRFVSEFTAGTTGQVRVVDAGSDLRVEVDLEGDNVADMVIQVVSVSSLRSADFVL